MSNHILVIMVRRKNKEVTRTGVVMRLVTVKSLKENIKLAKPVYNEKGNVLISEGISLTERMINRLIELGVTFVYIEDDSVEDIDFESPISQETRAKAMGAMDEAFKAVQNDKDLTKAFVFDKLGQKFSSVVRDLLSDIKNHPQAISLLSDVYSYDNYIFTHSLNVTIYTLALSLKLNLPQKNIEEIGLGAMLHDVGKMMVPLDILLKPGRLTDSEFVVIKQHAEDGFNILRRVPNIPLVAAHCAYQHHERLDGSGYPRGLEGDKIHYYSKIIGITDVYDAVTTNRVYRAAMLPHEGLEILYAGSGTQFDKDLVEAFRRSVAVYPVGLTCYLSDGRKGIVVRQNEGLSERPIIRVTEENNEVCKPYEIDLKEELSVVITETDTTLIGKSRRK